ncbi:MAG: hypothetical protein ACRCYC_05540 [Paraclostridium sp.]|uniref:hypothetical protein n=1 Tax=Paraclostridium sp. TaxID=2023273 RepID=UPI003F344D2E
MENNQDKVTSSNNKIVKSSCKNDKKNFGLSNYTYADYVILSSTLAYAISEELNDDDLDFFLVFLSQVSSDLALLRTKRGFEKKANQVNQSQEQIIVDEAANEDIINDITVEQLGRNKKRKRKKVKKLR